MTQCPFCVESLEESNRKCPHCLTDLGSLKRLVGIVLWVGIFCLITIGAYYFYVALQPGSLGSVLIQRLLRCSIFLLAGLYLALVHRLFNRRKRLGICLWLVCSMVVGVSAVYARCWNEMRAYRSNLTPLLSRLDYLQEKAKNPAKLSDELRKLESEWSKFSRVHAPRFATLSSYQKVEQALTGFAKGDGIYRGALANRWNSVLTDISSMKRSTEFSPQAMTVYKFELKKAQKAAAVKILAAKKKVTIASAAAEAGLRRVEQAQKVVNSAENRVNRAYDNSTRSVLGEGNVFSAEFNSNRDPSAAYDYLHKCQQLLSEATAAGEKLDEQLESARSQLSETESAANQEAEEKADAARQTVQNQLDHKRFAAKQEEMNKTYAAWFQATESNRLANLDKLESNTSGAKLALQQERPWQLISAKAW